LERADFVFDVPDKRSQVAVLPEGDPEEPPGELVEADRSEAAGCALDLV
jgi:hypothetical protein